MLDNFSLEEALHQLENFVSQLESGEQNLDEAVTLFEQGQQLLKHCQKDLDAKELRIQQILEDDTLAPLNLDR